MTPMRKPAAPTYAQLFGDGSGTSSSGPSSFDAVIDSHTSQRVSSSPPPPPQMPPPPPPAAAPQPFPESAVHPALCVPSYAPFARYTMEDLLAQPGREGLDILDPEELIGFRSVSATTKGYYDGAYPNWSNTPNQVKITWFKCFVPTELTKDVWDGLIAYWEHPSSIKKANSCSASRWTQDKGGHLPMLHRTGQKPHAGIRLEVFEKTGVLPFLSELFKMTHATSDRAFVDHASEKLFQVVATRIEERGMQLTHESPDGLPVTLSTEDADRIFEEKGRIVGIGSVNEVARATSSYTSRRDGETSQMKARMDSQLVRLDSLEDLLDVVAVGNPVMQRMLSERRAALGLPVRDPQESDPTRQQPSNLTDYFEDM
uniref:Uncharacterized protein n=1 Tax=Brassica oleracea var. oleracea TaxID=109376 RepID=A0A0D3DV63_BRAOL